MNKEGKKLTKTAWLATIKKIFKQRVLRNDPFVSLTVSIQNYGEGFPSVRPPLIEMLFIVIF